MASGVIGFLGRTVRSDAFDQEVGAAVCWLASVVVLFVSWWKLAQLNLSEAQLFFGMLLSLCPPLLLVIVGLVLPTGMRAWKPHS